MNTQVVDISATDTAKLVRKRLRELWPNSKFSVRTSKYSGGASIDVTWSDGPTEEEVRRVVSPYGGRGFDGMTDSTYRVQAWMHADGSVTFAESGATGSQSAQYAAPNDPSAQLVHFYANSVSTRRTITDDAIRAALPVLPIHATKLDLGPGNGIYYYCQGCGGDLPAVCGLIRHRDGSWPPFAYCGADWCGAKVALVRGVIRPKSARRAEGVSA